MLVTSSQVFMLVLWLGLYLCTLTFDDIFYHIMEKGLLLIVFKAVQDQMLVTWILRCLLLVFIYKIVNGDYGHGKCSTHYETVHAVVYDTVYKKKCSEGSDEKCKIIHIHSYKVYPVILQ